MSKKSSNVTSKELEVLKMKRRFLRKSVTDTLKTVDDVLSNEGNRATEQVLKDKLISKWENLQEVEGSICNYF